MRNYLSYLRSHYPESFGIRRNLQRLKVKRIRRFTLPSYIVKKCENNPDQTEALIAPFVHRWKKYLEPCFEEMEIMLHNIPNGERNLEELKNDMLFCRLAYGFIPSEYIGFNFASRNAQERKSFCSDLDTNVFGYTVNNIVEVQKVLNKASSAKKYSKLFHRDFVVVSNKNNHDEYVRFVNKHPTFVKKKVFSSMGKGVEYVDIQNQNMEEYFNKLIISGTWLLEELVVQRSEMTVFNSSSVNTVRCITLKLREGVVVPYCFMRTGRNGSFVDNGGAGGLLMGIDVKTGIINTDGFDEYGNRFDVHPDSKKRFLSFKIPEWDKMLSICKQAAQKETCMNYLSWDMAYTEKGWSVIEVNEVGQFIGPQIVYQRGIKSELKKYLKDMEHVI